jgi:cysteine-rich repeat protein
VVTLVDGVESKVTRVVKTTEFCNAVDKDGNGIEVPNAHLQCYQISDSAGQTRFSAFNTSVDNEFGDGQALTLKRAKRVCVPASQDGSAIPPSLDSFKCYTATIPANTPKFVPVNAQLTDPFETKLMTVQAPESVCNAVQMDGGMPTNPAAQLHCYKIKQVSGQASFIKRALLAGNDFASESLSVPKPKMICVPSTRTAPASCGDGFRDPGEQCDDGDTVPGDGCDEQCRLEACGNSIVNSGEDCDDGPANGTNDCCTTQCHLVDPDNDNVCTRDDMCPADSDNDSDHDGYCVGDAFQPPAIGMDDPCSRAGSAGDWIKPKAQITKLDLPPGQQKLKITGAITIPTGGQPIAPQARGVHLRIVGPTGALVLDQHVPPGFFSTTTPIGWTVKGTPPSKYTYTDKAIPPVQNGIKKITITDKSAKVPGLITFSIVGDRGSYPLASGESPITVALELNDTGTPSGATPGSDQCGEVRYQSAPLLPGCAPGTNKITCK